MRVKRLTTLMYAASAAILCLAPLPTSAQISGATTLRIDIENYVPYNYDVFDPTKFATVADRTAVPPGVPFGQIILIGDIVAVNGTPVKGVWVLRGTNLFMTPDIGVQAPGQPPASRQSIADLARSHIQDLVWEILQPDGTPIGTIMASGFSRGTPPPGAAAVQTLDNLTITGGTGAFVGARGQGGLIDVGSPRQASVTEASANRRLIGGAKRSYILQLLPMQRPEVVLTTNGPAVVHAGDFTLVTAAKPAKAGEVLSLFASGLGAASAVQVLMNGSPAEVLYAGAYPGAADRYQVNFRVPDQTTAGDVGLRLSQAWVDGTEVRISTR